MPKAPTCLVDRRSLMHICGDSYGVSRIALVCQRALEDAPLRVNNYLVPPYSIITVNHFFKITPYVSKRHNGASL